MEMSNQASPELAKKLKLMLYVQKTLWIALSFASLLFIVLAQVAVSDSQEREQIEPTLRYVLYGLAVVLVFTSFSVKKFFEGGKLPMNLNNVKSNYRNYEELSLREKALIKAAHVNFLSLVLLLGINELVATIGFIGSVLTGDVNFVTPFALLAFALNLLYVPTINKINSLAANFESRAEY